MKRAYARLVLFLIRPALVELERERLAESSRSFEEWCARLAAETVIDRASDPLGIRSTEAYRSAFSRAARGVLTKLSDSSCSG